MADVNSVPQHPERRSAVPDPSKPVYTGPERRKTPRQEFADEDNETAAASR